jgi:hypothetical protein
MDDSGDAELHLNRPKTLARMGEHRAATEAADELGKIRERQKSIPYHRACVYSLASSAALRDDKLPLPARMDLAERYAGRALELLAEARNIGFFKSQNVLHHLTSTKDLDAIREREEFRKLLVEVKAERKTAK